VKVPDSFKSGPQVLSDFLAPSSPPSTSRILALDVGDRRIGLALSDPLGYTAQPLFTMHRSSLRADLKSIGRLVRKHSVTVIVIGLPLHASGELSPQAFKTERFADALRQQNPTLNFYLIDERLTTAEAHTILDHSRPVRRSSSSRQERNSIIDQVAAVLLLETFLSTLAPRLLPPPPDL